MQTNGRYRRREARGTTSFPFIRIGAITASPSPAADAADGELSREALLMARAAGQIDRAPIAGQIDGELIHEGPGRRITFVA